MAQSKAQTVNEYLAELLPDRRQAVSAVRKVILDNLPEGYKETMDFGMIAYVVPLERYPATYNKHPMMYAALASQKNYISLYLMSVYVEEEAEHWFHEAYRASGKRLDLGKSCVRFKRTDDLPIDLIGKAVARTPVERFIELAEASRRSRRKPSGETAGQGSSASRRP